ncbi:MAG: ATPase, T2SS/T4P/T4SS family [Planctomycetota bacterium]
MDPTRLGQLAIAYGLIDSDQLERALRAQERASPPRYLGEVMVEEGLIDAQDLRRLLSAQRTQLERVDPDDAVRFERTQIAARLTQGLLRDYLEVMLEAGAEELHLAAGARPTLRQNGGLFSIRPEPLGVDEAWELLGAVLRDAAWERFRRARSQHFVHVEPGLGRFRASYFLQRRGPSAVFCALPAALPPLEDLGLPPSVLEEVPRTAEGLVLVTGPRASGKTTTLAALVELINQRRRRHVVCLEEGLEFVHTSRHSLITQRRPGDHSADWERALHDALREGADVIVLADATGPLRFEAALRAAEAGRLVLAAIQTQGVEQTLQSVSAGCTPRRRPSLWARLSTSLRLMLSQRLVPGADGKRLQLAAEVMVTTPDIRLALMEGRFHQLERLIQHARGAQGMITHDDCLLKLVGASQITPGDALAHARDREALFSALRTQTRGRA